MSRRITEEQKQIALENYIESGNLTDAANAAGVARWTLWQEGKRNKDFREALDFAKQTYNEQFEKLLDERIKDPSDLYKDKASALLLMFKLKAEYPDKYRERIDHKVEGNVKIITGVPRPEK